MEYRIGSSYDVHALKAGNQIKLGGINIPCEYSCIAHSDGDVVFHSLSEAMLGSLALGDLGTYFPDNDPKYLNYDSSKILEFCYSLVKKEGYIINNIDISIILEKPKLKDYILSIRENIANLLQIDISQISIKAMTNEKLDSLGQNKAVASFVSLLIKKE